MAPTRSRADRSYIVPDQESNYLGGIGSQFRLRRRAQLLATGKPDQPGRHRALRLPGMDPEQPFHRHPQPELLAQGEPYLDSITYKPIPIPTRSWPASTRASSTSCTRTTGPPSPSCADNTKLGYVGRLQGRRRRAGHGLHPDEPVQGPVHNAKLAPGHGYATSSEQYVQVIDGGVTEPTTRVFTAGSPYYLTDNGYPAYNLAQGQAAGLRGQVLRGSVAFTLATPRTQGQPDRPVLPAVLQSAGMQVTLVPILQDSIINVALTGAYEALTWRQFGPSTPPQLHLLNPTTASTRVRHQTWPRNTDRPCRRRCSRGVSQPTRPRSRRLPAGEPPAVPGHPLRLVRPDRVAIGTSRTSQNIQHPSTPAGGKAFAYRRRRSGPSRSAVVGAGSGSRTASLDDRPARSGRGVVS